MADAPATAPQPYPGGGWTCNQTAGCDQPAELTLAHTVTADTVAGVTALPWPDPVVVGDQVAVWACHDHVPAGETHVCGNPPP